MWWWPSCFISIPAIQPSRFSCSSPASAGAQGYTEDVRIAFREQERIQTQLFYLLGKHANRDWKDIEKLFERDRYMHTQEAKEYGLIDEILGNASELVTFENGKLKVPSVEGQGS